MTMFLKSLVVAAALVAGAASINTASAESACQSGQISVHGVWDCR